MNEQADQNKTSDGDSLERRVMHVAGMKFITNFDIRDYAKYCEAVDKWEHGGKLTLKYVDRWGRKDSRMGSLYCANEINGLSPFWDIFRALESA
ncbi:hypothetical protein KAR91_78445 [Candidatus Pacearchaeota archaeon]|nr:hypothetical protein [Candidatus Pacearchaeota archaeon]